MEKKHKTLHTSILFTLTLIVFVICIIITVIKFFTFSNDSKMWIAVTLASGLLWGIGSLLDDYCCPECGGWFCLSKQYEKTVGQKSITMKETRRVQKYSDGKMQHGEYQTYTVDVPGVEYKIEVTYRCRKCNSYVTRQKTERQKS